MKTCSNCSKLCKDTFIYCTKCGALLAGPSSTGKQAVSQIEQPTVEVDRNNHYVYIQENKVSESIYMIVFRGGIKRSMSDKDLNI